MSWKDESWKEAALEYHAQRGGTRTVIEIEPERLRRLRRLLADNVSVDQAWRELYALKDRAAPSTVEALMYSLRERGVTALSERDCQRRLAELSSAQVREVIGRLMALRLRYPAITDELLFLLGDQLR